MSKGHKEVVKQYVTDSDFETKSEGFNKEGNLMHQVMLVYMRMVMLSYLLVKRPSTLARY